MNSAFNTGLPLVSGRVHAMGNAMVGKVSRKMLWPQLHRQIKQSLKRGKTIPTDSFAFKVLSGIGAGKRASALEKRLYASLFDYPKKIDIFINTACQFSCKYCFIDKSGDQKTFSDAEIYDLISQAAKLGVHVVQILGGEPTLHPSLFNFIDEVASQGMIAVLYTNGERLDENMLQRLRAYGDQAAVFFNFDHERAYETLTGKATYHKVKATMERAKALGISVGVFITVTKYNVDVLRELVDLCLSMGIVPTMERFIPQKQHPEHSAELAITAAEWRTALSMMAERSKALGFMPSGRAGAALTGTACPDYFDNLSILPRGEILPCPFAPISQSFANAREESLAEIWSKLKERRKVYQTLPDECSGCGSAHLCGGGCKTYAFIAHGRYDKRDPDCEGHNPAVTPFKW